MLSHHPLVNNLLPVHKKTILLNMLTWTCDHTAGVEACQIADEAVLARGLEHDVSDHHAHEGHELHPYCQCIALVDLQTVDNTSKLLTVSLHVCESSVHCLSNYETPSSQFNINFKCLNQVWSKYSLNFTFIN